MKMKNLLRVGQLSPEDVEEILAVSLYLKGRVKQGIHEDCCCGMTLAMLFAKASLRTRVSFEVGMMQLGGQAMYVSQEEIGLGQRESVKDVARVLSRYVDILMIRHPVQQDIEALAQYASIPVINGLSSQEHPCQALADLLTIREIHGDRKVKVVFVGDANNVSSSLGELCAMMGMRFAHAAPAGYRFKPAFVTRMKALAKKQGGSFAVSGNPMTAVKGADVLYTDVWASMGQEAELPQRRVAFADYKLNRKLLGAAKPNAVVMHCLPANRGEEISNEVVDGSRSAIYQQAENRLHAQKGLMKLLLCGGR